MTIQHIERDLLESNPLGIEVLRFDSGERNPASELPLFVNTSLVNMFRAPSVETLLRRPAQESWLDDNLFRKTKETLRSGDSLINVEAERLRMDGSAFWVSMTSQTAKFDGRPHTVVWHSDITDNKHLVRALKGSETQFRDFAESIADWFWETDAELRFTYLSPSVERHLAKPPEWYLGRPREVLLSPDFDRDLWRQHQESLRKRIPFRDFIYLGETFDGKARWLKESGKPIIAENGVFLGYRGTGTNASANPHTEPLLQDAIFAMSEGFAYYDSEERLVFCNEPYRRSLPRIDATGILVPGMTFEEMLRTGIENGFVPDAYSGEEQYLSERLEKFRNPTGPVEYMANSGHWFRFEERKTLDGGTVTIRTDITARLQAEQALRESEERLRRIIDHSPSAIFLKDMQGRYTMANSAFGKWLGRAPSEIIGKTASSLFPAELAEKMDAQDQAIREKGRSFEQEIEVSFPDGKTRHIHLNKFPVRRPDGGIIEIGMIGTDVTARKEAELALRERATLLRSIVDNLPWGFSLKDTEGRYVLVNEEIASTVDAVTTDVIGKTVFDTGLVSDDASRIAELERQVVDTGSVVYEERSLRTGQDTYERSITKFPVMDSNDQVKWIGTISIDISERREVEALRLANAAKSEFLSSMSHELRTPLNSILGFGQLLAGDLEEASNAAHQRYTRQILKNGELLLELINQVLDLSRIETGNLPLNLQDAPLETIVNDCIAISQPLTEDRQISLAFVKTSDATLSCRADTLQLRQILLNLLSNAIKYNRDGGSVTVLVERRDETLVRITVADTGEGIDADQQDHLFEPFNRLGREASTIQGSGIGLTIAKRLIELMGGSIGFSSDSSGSVFWVELPISK